VTHTCGSLIRRTGLEILIQLIEQGVLFCIQGTEDKALTIETLNGTEEYVADLTTA